MWNGFHSINSDALKDLIKSKIRGPLCLIGMSEGKLIPQKKMINGKVIGIYQFQSVAYGNISYPWHYLIAIQYKDLRELACDIVPASQQKSPNRDFWMVARKQHQGKKWRFLHFLNSNPYLLTNPGAFNWLRPFTGKLLRNSISDRMSPKKQKKSCDHQPVFFLDLVRDVTHSYHRNQIPHQWPHYTFIKSIRKELAYAGGSVIFSAKPLQRLSIAPPEYHDWSHLILIRFPHMEKYKWFVSRPRVREIFEKDLFKNEPSLVFHTCPNTF